ncbi:uncharacterized protein LOC130164915 [Seriola aureovittata]|uniref:uncharacterized protein LOC130164915 n=1 Tax=Seriola aureovittata TaxID=2871759 RepID=UPI0024BE4438|nr:uncharacterized protein LOC130164915 [Seriola aureovittata]
MEGDNVTLRCRLKMNAANLPAEFSKDGRHIQNGSEGTMSIHSVSGSDEGLYRCSMDGAGESPQSWLTVMQNDFEGGSVILEIPALPVTEGDAVTLSCRNKSSSADVPAVFSKDGLFIGTSATGNMSIDYVYRSHEGLYRCSIPGAGESAGSWLTVRALHRDAWIFSEHFLHILLLVRTVVTVVMVALLLLLVALLHCGKLGGSQKKLQSRDEIKYHD